MTRTEEKVYDRAFGLHSNIPLCCVEFFIEEWDSWYRQEDHPYVRAVDAARFNYVPCPKCLGTNNKVKLKICVVECAGEHQDDFKPGGCQWSLKRSLSARSRS